jgi:hypothetical protein
MKMIIRIYVDCGLILLVLIARGGKLFHIFVISLEAGLI